MMKAAIEESPEATMARFLAGLNREVQDRLELQEYEDIYEFLHMATLIEKQLRGNRILEALMVTQPDHLMVKNTRYL